MNRLNSNTGPSCVTHRFNPFVLDRNWARESHWPAFSIKVEDAIAAAFATLTRDAVDGGAAIADAAAKTRPAAIVSTQRLRITVVDFMEILGNGACRFEVKVMAIP
jgi:hypothetical protein